MRPGVTDLPQGLVCFLQRQRQASEQGKNRTGCKPSLPERKRTERKYGGGSGRKVPRPVPQKATRAGQGTLTVPVLSQFTESVLMGCPSWPSPDPRPMEGGGLALLPLSLPGCQCELSYIGCRSPQGLPRPTLQISGLELCTSFPRPHSLTCPLCIPVLSQTSYRKGPAIGLHLSPTLAKPSAPLTHRPGSFLSSRAKFTHLLVLPFRVAPVLSVIFLTKLSIP